MFESLLASSDRHESDRYESDSDAHSQSGSATLTKRS
jgi:hypothetical protein